MKTYQQFIRFATIGVVNTLLDAAIYIGLTRGLNFFHDHILLAALIAFMIAGLHSFFWNKYWTFKESGSSKHTSTQLVQFYSASGVALIVNEFVLWTVVSMEVNDIIAKLIASAFAAGTNFLLQKTFVFTKKSKE